MNVVHKKKIVLLGMMSRFPVAGVVWQTVHYLVGFERLGYEVYYVEAHGGTPRDLMTQEHDDPWAKAAAYIDRVMRRFDLGGRWALHAQHADGRCFGLSEGQLNNLYQSAALIINLHGCTIPLPEHSATGRLIYVETDPVDIQIELHDRLEQTIDFLAPHCAFFTFGENFGNADCKLPWSERFHFRPTRQPVVLDFWKQDATGDRRSANGHQFPAETRLATADRRLPTADCFTTIANWKQPHRQVRFQGELYHWSKHYEFLKFLDVPARTAQPFELALASYQEEDRQLLQSKGWHVRHSLDFSCDLDKYRSYITDSRGEFTVAKDQNIRLRTGWFSDRSATYLAAGRPVITQDTAFGNILPTGAGLFAFSSMEDIVDAVEQINADYSRHSRAAAEVAREYFDARVVLKKMLAEVGCSN